MSNQLVGVNRRVHPYVFFGQERLLQQLGAFEELMGPQLLGAREMFLRSL